MSAAPGERAKRLLDLAVSLPLLALSAPVQLVVAVAIRISLGRPVLFRQVRPGLHGEPFTLLKFRTMVPGHDSTQIADDAARLTPLGRLLRATSLDELPTLWSVARGDMSLVGPRPLLMAYLPRYTTEQRRRHEVRPGVTGLAQVSGRNALSWDERLRLDVQYVENHSLSGDIRILAATVGSVLRREGISAPGQATVEEFRGTADRVEEL